MPEHFTLQLVTGAPGAGKSLIAPAWCNRIRWLLLDCADEVRIQRLRDRQWQEEQIRDALFDAAELRRSGIDTVIRTDELDQNAVIDAINSWQGRSL
jgi:broad-specificity NMP kinase